MKNTKTFTKAVALAGLAAVMLLGGCKKTPPETPVPPDDGPNGMIELSTESLEFPVAGNTQTVTVTGENWTATPNKEWIVVAETADGFTVTVGKNQSPSSRNGSVTVANEKDSHTVEVIQAGDADAIGLSADELFFIFEGETKTVDVESNSTWAATPSDPWIIVSKNAAGTGFTVVVGKWNGTDPRPGTITVDNGKRQRTITVTQEEHLGIELPVAYASHYFNTETTTTLLLGLSNAMQDFDPHYFEGTGYYLSSYITMPIVDYEYPSLEIAPGTYTFGPTYNNEFQATLSIQNIVDGAGGSHVAWTSGTLEVSGDHTGYTFAVKVTLENGDKFRAYSRRPMNIDNPNTLTLLWDDYEILPLTEGSIGFRGDVVGNGTHAWALEVYSAGISQTPQGQLVGTGNLLDIMLVSPNSGDGKVLPDGVYTFTDSEDYDEFTGIAGFGEWGYGSWVNEMTDDWIFGSGLAPLYAGTITTEYKGDDKYILTINAEDDAHNKLTGRFEGTLDWYNVTATPVGRSAQTSGRAQTSQNPKQFNQTYKTQLK